MSKDIFPIEDTAFDGLDACMEAVIKEFNVPGMGVAAIRGGQVVLSKGYGLRNVDEQLPIDSDTIFPIGSATKAFTTIGMAILVDRGELDWDKPVREYMPTFKLYDPVATERMTPRDLVCHRSGLPRHDAMWYNSSLSRREIFDRLRYLEPSKDFRQVWQYQNLMFLTAGMLVEQVSGLTWEEFIQKEVFDHLGMGRSNFSVEKFKENNNFTLPYEEVREKVKQIPFRNIDTIGPAGSINSCLSNMTQWVLLHLHGKVGEEQIVSQEQLKELHTPAMVMPEDFWGLENFKEITQWTYGLGWFVQYYRGRRFLHHGGAIDGFRAMVTFMPEEKLGTVVLTNLGETYAFWPATFDLYDRMLDLDRLNWRTRWLEVTEREKKAAKEDQVKRASHNVLNTKPSHDLTAYTGEFNHPGYGIFTVTLEDGLLEGVYNNRPFKLDHIHYDIFMAVSDEYMQPGGLPVSFQTDFQGNVASLSMLMEPEVKDILFERLTNATPYA